MSACRYSVGQSGMRVKWPLQLGADKCHYLCSPHEVHFLRPWHHLFTLASHTHTLSLNLPDAQKVKLFLHTVLCILLILSAKTFHLFESITLLLNYSPDWQDHNLCDFSIRVYIPVSSSKSSQLTFILPLSANTSRMPWNTPIKSFINQLQCQEKHFLL